MVKHRDKIYVRIIPELQASRINNEQCPACGKPKTEWNRRTDWRCCSTDCTSQFEQECIIRHWTQLRQRCFERDNFACVKCGEKHSDEGLIADHIIAIALGGEQWDINNIQTLCAECNKTKTRIDAEKIAKLRSVEKKQKNNMLLKNFVEVV